MDVSERNALVSSIAARLADYRDGQIPRINDARVLTWCNQFDEGDRPTILRETERILSKTYITRAIAQGYVKSLLRDARLVGADPEAFWKSVGFLRIQQTGASQVDMLALLDECLKAEFKGLTAESAASTNQTYLYLDDALFSGTRVKNDINTWAEANDVRDATVLVVCLAAYTGGEWHAKSTLQNSLAARRVKVDFLPRFKLESRRSEARDASVLWLTSVPENDAHVESWKATLRRQDWFVPRPPGGRASKSLFSSEESRHIIEQAFFKKGAYIYSLSGNPEEKMRPLGYSNLETPGFGATVTSYRNCPNNAPLVLWWGDPQAQAPLSRWTPLLPRLFGAGGHHA